MPDRETLLALAERCEAATEYDGRLMAEIDCAVRFQHLRPAEPDDHPTVKDRTFDPSSIWTPTGYLMSRNYWRSVDDAMTLVPPQHAVDLTIWAGKNRARILPIVQDANLWLYRGADPHYCSNASTPALALCAASLRAMAGEGRP